MKWFKIENTEFIPLTTYQYLTQKHITSYQLLNKNQIHNSFEIETNTWKLVKPYLGNVDIFSYVFMIIKHQQSMRKILYRKTLFTHSWASTELNKAQESFTLVHHHMETWE